MTNDELKVESISFGEQIGNIISHKEHNISKIREELDPLVRSEDKYNFLGRMSQLSRKYDINLDKRLLDAIDDKNWNIMKRYSLISCFNEINIKELELDEEVKARALNRLAKRTRLR